MALLLLLPCFGALVASKVGSKPASKWEVKWEVASQVVSKVASKTHKRRAPKLKNRNAILGTEKLGSMKTQIACVLCMCLHVCMLARVFCMCFVTSLVRGAENCEVR
jgi:hypothetical protein